MWSRPAGPPHVYREYKVTDFTGKNRKFSLQEIPISRYEEAVSHMCAVFMRDEALCDARDVINDPPSTELGKKLWRLAVSQGIAVAAYEILEGDVQPVLAGVNMLIYVNAEVEKALQSIEVGSAQFGKIIAFMMQTMAPVDPRKLYNVDRYLGALGLSIDPNYRRLGLGQKLLELRDQVGERYNIEYTSTIHTGIASQIAAHKAGFQTNLERLYDEGRDEDGKALFGKLAGQSVKVMGKRIS